MEALLFRMRYSIVIPTLNEESTLGSNLKFLKSLKEKLEAEIIIVDGQSCDKTKEIASQLASGPPIAMQYMKENLNRAISSGDLEDCMDLECTHHIHCAKTEDHKNAVQAFINKTKPVFNGR